jgi:hypothetical protein
MDQIAKKASQRGKCVRGPPNDKMKNTRMDNQRTTCNRGQPKEKTQEEKGEKA